MGCSSSHFLLIPHDKPKVILVLEVKVKEDQEAAELEMPNKTEISVEISEGKDHPTPFVTNNGMDQTDESGSRRNSLIFRSISLSERKTTREEENYQPRSVSLSGGEILNKRNMKEIPEENDRKPCVGQSGKDKMDIIEE